MPELGAGGAFLQVVPEAEGPVGGRAVMKGVDFLDFGFEGAPDGDEVLEGAELEVVVVFQGRVLQAEAAALVGPCCVFWGAGSVVCRTGDGGRRGGCEPG